MHFYIVTPTFNALPWLQRCIRSVADQAGGGVTVHHHVQDGGSTDGTPEWLAEWQGAHADTPGYQFSYESARDAGMYDAINRAWDKMPPQAEVTAHLNSDEQYLPGALAGVAAALAASPADVALGTYLVVDAESRYICHRRPVHPHVVSSRATCEIITCSCFHRREAFLRHGIRFDTRYRALADLIFYRDITATRPRFLLLPELVTSLFMVTGGNLAWTELARQEFAAYRRSCGLFSALCFPFWGKWVNFKRRLVDARCEPPRAYAFYMPGAVQRSERAIKCPTASWGMRSQGEE